MSFVIDQIILAITWMERILLFASVLIASLSLSLTGGGVMGAPGYNSAQIVKTDFAAM